MIDPALALDAVGLLPDPEIDLAGTAVHFARVGAPGVDTEPAVAHLSALARAAVALDLPADPVIRAGGLAGMLAGVYGYAGDTETYDDPANANLIRVIERRRGLPVALGILWLHCARAAGWPAHGIDFPGHFLVGIGDPGSRVIVDVFRGGVPLDVAALRDLLRAAEGKDAVLRPGLLAPMPARAVLLRLQNNLKARRLLVGDKVGALLHVLNMLRIAPDSARLWREAGLLCESLDMVKDALVCARRFLALVPEGEEADRVRQTADTLRARL